jgi:hypothetical protein
VDGDTVYLAVSDGHDRWIEYWNTHSKQAATQVALHDLKSLGPLFFDKQQKALFILDWVDGKVYKVALPSGKVDFVTDVLSQQDTSAITANVDDIFAATGSELVWFSKGKGTKIAIRLPQEAHQMAITGLAIDDNNNLWLADSGNHRLEAILAH